MVVFTRALLLEARGIDHLRGGKGDLRRWRRLRISRVEALDDGQRYP